MSEMIIRPGGTPARQALYASGRFSERGDSYLINSYDGCSPFGGTVCSLGSDYAVEIFPDGIGHSWIGPTEITPSCGMGKAWYIRDRETGDIWSPFFNPTCESADEYEVDYAPGQVTVHTLHNKLLSALTICTLPDCDCEIWRFKLENHSAKHRSLEITTFFEPSIAPVMDTRYEKADRTFLMRPTFGADDDEPRSKISREIVLFVTSTITPTRYMTHKPDFLGEDGNLRKPAHVKNEASAGMDGIVAKPIACFTIEIELPIEGEAEFAFTLGAAANAEAAITSARRFESIEQAHRAVEDSRKHWQELSSSVQVKSSDRVFDAIVNTWLPYDAYCAWVKERGKPAYLQPARVADLLRRIYAFCGTSPNLVEDALLGFAAGLSVMGTYSPDGESLVVVPSQELLWLVHSTAKYLAETGDAEILEKCIPLRDGPSLSLAEHCERILRMSLNAGQRGEFLERVARQWSLTGRHMPEIDEFLSRDRRLEKNQPSESRTLPRRVQYFQTICPSLADNNIVKKMNECLASDGTESDISIASRMHAFLVEHVLGIEATCEGISLTPHLPLSWIECQITRKFRGDIYEITIRRSNSRSRKAVSITADGEPLLGSMLPIYGDGKTHQIHATIA